MGEFKKYDISMEEYREYSFVYLDRLGKERIRVYRIDNPKELQLKFDEEGREIGTCHRVIDMTGKCHLPFATGVSGCVLSFENKDKTKGFTF